MRKTSVVGLTGIFLIAGMMAASPASAVTPDSLSDEDINSYSDSGLLNGPSNETTNGEYGTLGVPMSANPYGCTGQTDWPHWSNNQASVHARTFCKLNSPSEIGVSTQIRKVGWFGEWTAMASHQSVKYNQLNSQDAHPHWTCTGWGEQTYKGTSYHWAYINGTLYDVNTAGAEKRFSC